MFYVHTGNNTESSNTFALHQTAAFMEKTKWKITLILQVLKMGFNVLYADADVILLKDPFPYLESLSGYDFIAQKDGNYICSGFMYILSNPRSINAIGKAHEYVQKSIMRDQIAVNLAIVRSNISYYLLPDSLFPSGLEFFRRYQFYWDRNGFCYMRH